MEVKELNEILLTMNVPVKRRQLTPANVRWLMRNLGIQNGAHSDIMRVLAALKEIARGKLKIDCPNPGCHCGACG
tara:strand:- start:168 stop:392 length:225 start_codon:yes stop_codon:yes gene_type:complete